MAELARGLGLDRVLLVANKVRDENELAAVRSSPGSTISRSPPWFLRREAARGGARRGRAARLRARRSAIRAIASIARNLSGNGDGADRASAANGEGTDG
jgi:hypothetical protein